MALSKYTYSISGDFPNGEVATDALATELQADLTIIKGVQRIDTEGDNCDIWFKDSLDAGEEAALDAIVAAHDGVPLETDAEVVISDDSDKTITGHMEFNRDGGGVFIPGSGTTFPTTPTAKELFWKTDEARFYRRNNANDDWEAVGEVTGPASSTDNALVRFDGTTGKAIQQATNNPPTMDDNGRIQGTYTYPPSATDPTENPTPAAGDRYFNTVINEWMVYDSGRSKWLSQSLITLQAGRAGTVPSPGQLQGVGSMNSGPNRGLAVPKSTLVYLGIYRSDSDASQMELANNNSVIHTADIAAANHTEVDDINVDFAAGSVQFRVPPSQNEVENIQVTMLFRRRV